MQRQTIEHPLRNLLELSSTKTSPLRTRNSGPKFFFSDGHHLPEVIREYFMKCSGVNFECSQLLDSDRISSLSFNSYKLRYCMHPMMTKLSCYKSITREDIRNLVFMRCDFCVIQVNKANFINFGQDDHHRTV